VAVGRVVLVVGVLILLFIPYALWGTGLKTAHSQDQLRTEFHAALHRSVPPAGLHLPAPGSRPLADQIAPRVADPPIGGPVGELTIPSIGLSMVVVEGTGPAQLQAGPGHYPQTPLPGEAGNVAIAGHRTTYLHPFYDLNELVPGDAIYVRTLQGLFEYRVTGSQAVDPSNTSVLDATTTPQLTLTTCTPRYTATQRLIVHAVLVAGALVGSGRRVTAVRPLPQADARAGTDASWVPALLWGLLVAGLVAAGWWSAGRLRGVRRWAVLGAGTLVWLVVVFLFFQAAAPLLPASY
jgi:sortase A